MVRSIVGALVAVGEGRATADDVKRILDRASRTESFKVVAPHGLTLLEIGYPADSELASQAEKARNMRSLDSN
jgi:tRNA pseudouridine38-40 synthase